MGNLRLAAGNKHFPFEEDVDEGLEFIGVALAEPDNTFANFGPCLRGHLEYFCWAFRGSGKAFFEMGPKKVFE